MNEPRYYTDAPQRLADLLGYPVRMTHYGAFDVWWCDPNQNGTFPISLKNNSRDFYSGTPEDSLRVPRPERKCKWWETWDEEKMAYGRLSECGIWMRAIVFSDVPHNFCGNCGREIEEVVG